MKVWTERRAAPSGMKYEVRYLLTDAEAEHLQSVGVVGELWEVVGMQAIADMTMAQFEFETHTAAGGEIQ